MKEISDRQVKNQVHGVGEALVVQLEGSAASELSNLKKAIRKIVKSLPEDATGTDLEKAEDQVANAVRSAGVAVRNKAQSLRSWKQQYDAELRSLVSAASESTLEVIDNIRDLGLQEIGMRWAWMEGVTYKDWSKYHALKKTFDEWRSEVEAVAKEHESLPKARAAAEDVESKGMGIAEETAKELVRLKDVGMWKIHAGDASDDFSTKVLPAKAASVRQKVMDKISSGSQSVVGTSQGTIESIVSQATQQAADAANSASSQVIGTEPGMMEQATSKVSGVISASSQPAHESLASVAGEKASKISGRASEAVIGSSIPAGESVASAASSRLSEAGNAASKSAEGFKLKFVSSANSASSRASEAVASTSQARAESVVSAASKKADQAASIASEAIIGTPAPAHESMASEASESVRSAGSAASSVASQASKKVFAGAMAQKVHEQKPILDDVISDDEDSSYSEKMQSIVSQASDKYADVTRAVSEALLKATTTQGSAASATSLASAQYSSALAAASSILYGTQTGTGESVSSVASGKYAQAVAA